MNKIFTAALLGATLLAGSAVAQDRPMPRDPLARADADQDGVVTREELLADVDARFARLDADKDGKISAEERKAAIEARMGDRSGRGRAMLGRRDAKGAAVTLEEERARAVRRFDRIDANHDGRIDQAERDAIRDRMQSMRGRHGPPPPPPADAPDND